MKSNFKKLGVNEVDTQGTPYDYESIMHYSNTAFTRDYKAGNTIESKFDPNRKLGNSELSKTDITELNRLYQCGGKYPGFCFRGKIIMLVIKVQQILPSQPSIEDGTILYVKSTYLTITKPGREVTTKPVFPILLLLRLISSKIKPQAYKFR